jgi:dipeptidyl aminopeptidase/acylaminoacyl peptidase
MKLYRTLFLILFLFVLMPFSKAENSLFTIGDYFDITYMETRDITEDGQWLACTTRTMADYRLPRDHYRYGDPTYIRPSRHFLSVMNTKTGAQKKLFPQKVQARSLKWSPDGRMLAFFIFEKGSYRLTVWQRLSGKFEKVKLPKHGIIASNSHLYWSPQGRYLHFALRAKDWSKKSSELFKYAVEGPVIVHDSDEKFLLWEKLRRRRQLMVPCFWDRKEKKLRSLLPETAILSYRLSKDGSFAAFERDVTGKTDYDVIFGTTNQLEILPLPEGKSRVLLKEYKKRRLHWSEDTRVLGWVEKGDVYVMGIDDKDPRQLTGKKKEEKDKDKTAANKTGKDKDKSEDKKKGKAEDKDKDKKKQRFSIIRFSPDCAKLLCTTTPPAPDDEKKKKKNKVKPPLQYLLMDVKTGEREIVYELKGKPENRPTLRLIDWQPQGQYLYFSYSAPGKYDRGLIKLDLKSGEATDLIRSNHLYSSWKMSKNGKTFVFFDSDGDSPADLYFADMNFSTVRKISELNPQLKDKALCHTELISYRDADGKKLYGILYYPAN